MDAQQKKTYKIILGIIISIFVVSFLKFLWDGLFSDIIPWTKTRFSSYQSFDNLLYERNCFGGCFFRDELPEEAEDVKYYWHRRMMEIYAAYSVKLSDSEYEEIVKERLDAYYDELEEQLDSIVYVLQDDNYLYIEDSGWYREERLGFIDGLMRNAGANRQYYFLIVNEFNTAYGICYNGVILNDSTQELIEFSTEMSDDTVPYIRRLFWNYEKFYKEANGSFYSENDPVIFRQNLPESADKTQYYYCIDQEDKRFGYYTMLSETDYNAIKQERVNFYQNEMPQKPLYDYSKIYDVPVGLQQLEQMRIDFLGEFCSAKDLKGYYILCARAESDNWNYGFSGVICNDETCEIIEFFYDGPREFKYKDMDEPQISIAEIVFIYLELVSSFCRHIIA